MAKTALVTGRIEGGTITRYRPVHNPFVAMYLTDGDWCHPGKCFDRFLDDQWSMGSYELASIYDNPHDAVWHAIIEVGGWTLEYDELHTEWFQEENPGFDPHTQPCYTCGKALL